MTKFGKYALVLWIETNTVSIVHEKFVPDKDMLNDDQRIGLVTWGDEKGRPPKQGWEICAARVLAVNDNKTVLKVLEGDYIKELKLNESTQKQPNKRSGDGILSSKAKKMKVETARRRESKKILDRAHILRKDSPPGSTTNRKEMDITNPARGTTEFIQNDSTPLPNPLLNNKHTVNAEDSTPIAAEEATPIAAENATPIAAEEATPIAAENATPIAAEEATPIAAENATPIAADNATPIVAEVATPIASSSAPEDLTTIISEDNARFEDFPQSDQDKATIAAQHIANFVASLPCDISTSFASILKSDITNRSISMLIPLVNNESVNPCLNKDENGPTNIPVVSTMDTATGSTIDNQARDNQAKDNEANSVMDNEAYSAMDNEANSAMDNEATLAMNNEANSAMDDGANSKMDYAEIQRKLEKSKRKYSKLKEKQQLAIATKDVEIEAKIAEIEVKTAEIEAKQAEIEARKAEIEAKNAEIKAKDEEIDQLRRQNSQLQEGIPNILEKYLYAIHKAIQRKHQTCSSNSSMNLSDSTPNSSLFPSTSLSPIPHDPSLSPRSFESTPLPVSNPTARATQPTKQPQMKALNLHSQTAGPTSSRSSGSAQNSPPISAASSSTTAIQKMSSARTLAWQSEPDAVENDLSDSVFINEEQRKILSKIDDYGRLACRLMSMVFSREELINGVVCGLKPSDKTKLDEKKVQFIEEFVQRKFPNADLRQVRQKMSQKCRDTRKSEKNTKNSQTNEEETNEIE